MINSLLYVPGDRADRITKAFASEVDAVLIDLEDAVAPTSKTTARANATTALLSDARPPVWIRINAGDAGREDLAAITMASRRPAGVVLAKCEERSWIEEVSAGVGHDAAIAPLIESARALRRLDELCAAPNVAQCHLGEIDLLADLGIGPAAVNAVIPQLRLQLVIASAAAAIAPPIAGVFVDIRDTDGLAEESRHLAEMGFAGRPALHPMQVPVINTAFKASPAERSAARRLVESFDAFVERGVGVMTDENGRMIDEAVVRRARRLIQ